MKKFKINDEIVRVSNEQGRIPLGYKTKVLLSYEYTDARGHISRIYDEFWELAEDTSKPVYTKLMWQCDELPKIGMRFATEAGEYIAEYTNEKSVCFTDENGFLVAINRAYAKPIPAPIELIDGNAYMFDHSNFNLEDVVGLYEKNTNGFQYSGGYVILSPCTNIRPMTVAESK
jgi:hypothetical protein